MTILHVIKYPADVIVRSMHTGNLNLYNQHRLPSHMFGASMLFNQTYPIKDNPLFTKEELIQYNIDKLRAFLLQYEGPL